MLFSCTAVAAVSADDVAFGGHPLTDAVAGDAGAEPHDPADEFMADEVTDVALGNS